MRIDLLVLYDPKQLIKAEKVDDTKPSVAPHLEEYLWKFKNLDKKANSVVGIVKILKK